jgi:hypothetical protein
MQALDRYPMSLVLLYSIEKLTGSTQGVEKIHIDDMVTLIQNNRGNKYLTPNKHWKITLQNKQVQLEKMS